MTCTNPDWLGNVWEKKTRRKASKAINEQPCLLKQDHEQGKRRAIYLKRADDFGVHISQIKNWYKRYCKQRRTSWGNGFVANVPYLWSVSERKINNISKQNSFIYIHMYRYAVIIKQNDQTDMIEMYFKETLARFPYHIPYCFYIFIMDDLLKTTIT